MPMFLFGGVYLWRNKVTRKVYVGSSNNLARRQMQHVKSLNARKHHNIHFQRSWNKHGSDCFEFKVLERCLPGRLEEREQYWIDRLSAHDSSLGYNINPLSNSPAELMSLPEVRKSISVALKGRVFTDEWRAKIGEASRNRSLETRKKLAVAATGKRYSDATKKKKSESMRKAWLNPEHRQRVSTASKGRKKSAETRARMKLAQQKRFQDPVELEGVRNRAAYARSCR